MDEIIKYLVANPEAFYFTAIIAIIIVAVSLVIIIILVVQGREISVGKIKFGAKPAKVNDNKASISLKTNQENDKVSAVPIDLSNKKPDNFDDALLKAREINMLGLNLQRTTNNNFELLREKAETGGSIRVIIADPEKIDHKEVIARFAPPETDLAGVEASFKSVINWYKELEKASIPSASVELRLIDFIPPYSLYIFPEQDKEFVLVEIYRCRARKSSAPKFVITKQNNTDWYNHFVDQFESIWDAYLP